MTDDEQQPAEETWRRRWCGLSAEVSAGVWTVRRLNWGFWVLHDLCCCEIFLFPPRCLSVKTEPGLFEAPNVSALTFELANANLAPSRTTGMWSRWRKKIRKKWNRSGALTWYLILVLDWGPVLDFYHFDAFNTSVPVVFSPSREDLRSPPSAAEPPAKLRFRDQTWVHNTETDDEDVYSGAVSWFSQWHQSQCCCHGVTWAAADPG